MLHSRLMMILCTLLGCAAAHPAAAQPIGSDEDRPAPFDYGYGPGVRVPTRQASLWSRVANTLAPRPATPYDTQRALASRPRGQAAPPANGGPAAGTAGLFGPVLAWPIIPLHMALLPDGRVMNYGTDENGKQGASMFYDVWDPTQPYETSHTVLPNVTATDIFCSGFGLLPNGNLLITGGDATIGTTRNYSNAKVNIFAPATNTLSANGSMTYPRWYPSDVPLTNGDHFIVGGRSNQKPSVPVAVPEYYSAGSNVFAPLAGAAMPSSMSWYYPKTFVTSSGAIYLVNVAGQLANFTTGGNGSFKTATGKAAPGLYDLPTVMYSPGKLLSIRQESAITATTETYTFDRIDLTAAKPAITPLPSVPGQGREWANMTVLADGTVFVNGGSGTDNVMSMVSYGSQLYNPATSAWTPGATAAEPRLYHSAALLLPDATVLTGGGGAPGPTNELNAEIYYPPYLFAHDGSGAYAPRPVIAAAPATVAQGGSFTLAMADAGTIGAVNLVRLGAVTHSTSLQTRFIPAAFTQNGATLTVAAPANPNDFLTGYWMVFVLNRAGVPSIAAIVQVPLS